MTLWLLQSIATLIWAVTGALAAGVLQAHLHHFIELAAAAMVAGPVALPLGVAVLAGAAIGWAIEPWHLRTMVRQLLEAEACPACRYPLASLEADDRGLTTCPECGGQWSLQSLESGSPA